MSVPQHHSVPHRPVSLVLALARLSHVLAGLGLLCLLPCPASGQDRGSPTLRLEGVSPGGVRNSSTASWGSFDFQVINLTDEDRHARVLVFYQGQPDVQYGRDVWVPARATLSSWMLVGPAPTSGTANSGDIEMLLYDRSDGRERLILPPGEERVRSRGVLSRKRDPFTSILLDEEAGEGEVFGRLPQPETARDEAIKLVRVFRHSGELSEFVHDIPTTRLPASLQAYDGIDHFVLASDRIAQDPNALATLRHWLQQGGRVWVMLDRVAPEVAASLLGDAPDFQVVDRVSLTDLTIEPRSDVPGQPKPLAQHHERPVDFVRVLLPPRERPAYTVNGWPAWFSRSVGRGKVVFSTLGPRAWVRSRQRPPDPPSRFDSHPNLPVALPPLEGLASELELSRETFRVETFGPMLAEEVGYSVVNRVTVALVFGGALAVAVTLGLVLRRSRRRELLGVAAPAGALAAAVVFVALGEMSRRAVPPTVAVAQVVDAVPGTDELTVRGLLAMYRPESGPVEAGTERGGVFELDAAGIEGRTRRLVMTDLGSWHWDNLSMPAGVRLGTFRSSVSTPGGVAAVARFGPEGIEGTLTPGPFRGLTDAIVTTPTGRTLSIHLAPDGTFRADGSNLLPPGQFLAGGVLSDRQQRRQEIYREFLKRPGGSRYEPRTALLAWAEPLDLGFTLAPGARTAGSALLTVPLRLERLVPGSRVTIPGPLVTYSRVTDIGPTRPTFEGVDVAELNLRFQLPPVVLPFQVERARLTAKIRAPSRRITVAGRGEAGAVELTRVESPLDPIFVEIADERLLRPDERGGLLLDVSVSETTLGPGRRDVITDDRWTIEYLELEVVGRTER